MSPLAADLSDLPRGNADTRTGLVPDETPRFVGVLADAWATVHDDHKPTAGGTRFRHSDAGKCARAISYTAAGIPRSDPMDLTGVWNVTLGSLLHDAWQKALLERYPDAEVEVKCGWDDLDASGHIDAVIRVPIGEDDEQTPGTLGGSLLAEGSQDGDLLDLDRSNGGQHGQGVRGDRSGTSGGGEHSGLPVQLPGRDRADTEGLAAGPSLQEHPVRPTGSSGTGDATREHHAERVVVGETRPQDALSAGPSIRRGEHLPPSERGADVSGVRADRQPTPVRHEKVIAYELKSIGGYGFKSSVGKARRGTPAEGPRSEHILQAALSGLAIDADEIVIGYLAKECISMNAGAELTELGRFACEWTLTRDQFEPLAREEKARVAGILALVDDGMLAARKVPGMPPGAEIVDVATSRWEQHDHDGTLIDTDCLWNESFCNYCSFHTVCATTAPGRISIASVEVTP